MNIDDLRRKTITPNNEVTIARDDLVELLNQCEDLTGYIDVTCENCLEELTINLEDC